MASLYSMGRQIISNRRFPLGLALSPAIPATSLVLIDTRPVHPEQREITHRVTTESIDPQLRHNSLGLPELVFQGVTHIAPATNMVFTFPIIALKAGPDMPLSFLLATVVCFFIGNSVAQFSQDMPSSGGYYSFATRGLGSRIGFMATWSYLVYDLLGSAGSTGFLGYLISDMLRAGFGVNIPWWLIALVTFAVIWTLTHRGIRISAHVTAILGGLELMIMLTLAITF